MEKNLEKSIRSFLTYTKREEDTQTAIEIFREFIDCVKSSTHAQVICALENVVYDFALENNVCPECNDRLTYGFACNQCFRSY